VSEINAVERVREQDAGIVNQEIQISASEFLNQFRDVIAVGDIDASTITSCQNAKVIS
jgi:hypothetical protein